MKVCCCHPKIFNFVNFCHVKIILGPSINVLLNCVITGRSIERKESSICFCLKETSRGGNLATGIRFNGE